MTLIRRLCLSVSVLLTIGTASGAETLELEVSGKITQVTDQRTHTYRFSGGDILALPKRHIDTSTNWTPKSRWEGPGVADILQKVGAHGTVLHVSALDNYSVDIPVDDVKRYGLVLAYDRDGARLPVKAFGPLMVIYPRDQYPDELNKASIERRFIWQVSKIEVR